MSDDVKITPADYSVVVKRRDPGERPGRWEIWVAGKSRPIERSEQPFTTMSEAMREGKAAFKTFLTKRFSQRGVTQSLARPARGFPLCRSSKEPGPLRNRVL
jgi:hypothetical protein